MAKYDKRHPQSTEKIKEEAMKIARGTQKPGQTKEQTKLIAQGIQKGIEQYKKQHKSKARELDKKLKSANKSSTQDQQIELVETEVVKQHWLPWVLLAGSWIAFGTYFSLMP